VGLLDGAMVVTRQGGVTTYRYAHWLPLLIYGTSGDGEGYALLRVLAGLSRTHVLTATLFLAACAVLIGSGLRHDKVTVSRAEFTYRSGAWFAVRGETIPFARLSHIDIISEMEGAGRDAHSVTYLVCYGKDGGSERVEVNELMELGAEAAILRTARGLGIPVTDHTSRW
jgi:hypothetical protein